MEDAINQRDDHLNLSTIGKHVILPASYNGGPHDMHQQYQDSMALACHFKKIDIFMTMTTNTNWSEISWELLPGQHAFVSWSMHGHVLFKRTIIGWLK